jgi:WD40 repeat protein
VVTRGARSCRIREATGHRQVAELRHGDAVLDVSFNGDGSLAATVSQDGFARLFELPGGKELRRAPVGGRSVRRTIELSPDGTRALIDGRAVWDTSTEAVVPVAEPPTLRDGPVPEILEDGGVRIGGRDFAVERAVRSAVLGPKGETVALLDRDDERVAEVWDVDSRERRRLLAQETGITAVALDPAEGHVALCSRDRAVRIWSIDEGVQTAVFHHDADVVAAEFSPDGKHVLSAGGRSDRRARLWLWRPEDLIAEACRRLPRDLTAGEWARYLGDEEYRETTKP